MKENENQSVVSNELENYFFERFRAHYACTHKPPRDIKLYLLFECASTLMTDGTLDETRVIIKEHLSIPQETRLQASKS